MGASNPSVGLTKWVESETLYSGKYYTRFAVSSTQTNVDAVVTPKGTGGFSLQQADGTNTGGDARGNRSVDLTLGRSLATQVASGTYSFAQGYSCTSIGNMVRITGTTITSVQAFDNVGDTAITYIWKNVNGESELPAEFPVAWNNYTVVVGGKTSGNAQYWLKYSDGVWKETYDPTIYSRLNYTTMPHKLTRKEDISGNVYFDTFNVCSE